MPKTNRRKPRLGPRDNDIFEHVSRYRLTTREVLHRLFFAEVEMNAVTKVTSRLCRDGFLNRYDLYPSRSYFVLGGEGARFLGISKKRTEAMGVQSLPIEYATLAYCTAAPGRERLTRRELQEHHPQYLVSGVDSSHYYLDHDGEKARLAYIRVDCGGSADHVIRKCRGDLEERQEHEAFAALIERNQFLIAVATGRAEKAAAIHESLKRHQWPIRFRIEVIPELVNLIPRFAVGQD